MSPHTIHGTTIAIMHLLLPKPDALKIDEKKNHTFCFIYRISRFTMHPVWEERGWPSSISGFFLYCYFMFIILSCGSSFGLNLAYIFCHYHMELGSKLTRWGNIKPCLPQGSGYMLLSLLEVDSTKRRSSGSQYWLPTCYRSCLRTTNKNEQNYQ